MKNWIKMSFLASLLVISIPTFGYADSPNDKIIEKEKLIILKSSNNEPEGG
ncbi:hypothetical protein ACSVDA_23940 [Cytobacillus sp. Hm23]